MLVEELHYMAGIISVEARETFSREAHCNHALSNVAEVQIELAVRVAQSVFGNDGLEQALLRLLAILRLPLG